MPSPAIPQEISLTLFGGMDTSLTPATLPEGLSPACNDVIFAPGLVGSRPCAQGLYNGDGFTGNFKSLWGKKYLQANNQPLNLLLDSQPNLYSEDPVNNPNIRTKLGALSPAVKTFKSVTLDGVEYIAFSDGINGQHIPMFYDTDLGVLDRISKDGVGSVLGSMTAVDITTTVNITSVTLSNLATISTATESGNVATITTSSAHGLTGPTVFVNIAGVSVAGYNGGAYQVGQIVSSTSFTVVNAGTGLGAGAGGTMGLALVTVVTSSAHGLNVGDAVIIQGSNSSFNNTAPTTSSTNTPAYWTVVSVVNATTFIFGLSGPSGTINTTTLSNGGAQGTIKTGGLITAGTHQVAVSFLWRGGYVTKPCPPISWTSLGNAQSQLAGIPTGPSGVIARILHFTGAGGGNFFNIPQNVVLPGNSLLFNNTLAPATTIKSTWILDNTTTSLIVDFPDNTLFAAQAIDVAGNNLFALVVLGPCIGMEAYASRLFAYGEVNKVQNFLNMGFDGGPLAANPLGWTAPSGGGSGTVISGGSWAGGAAYQITGDGVNHQQGVITQTAFQDYLFESIIDPNTQYSVMLWAKASQAGLSGTIQAILSSAATGFTATASVNINTVTTSGGFLAQFQFSQATPAVIPSDLTLTLCSVNLNNAQTVAIDELMIVFTEQPQRWSFMRGSYVNNFESFDGVTGDLGPEQDPTQIRDTFQLRQTLNILTARGWHRTIDNGQEPSTWNVDEIERGVGVPSIHSATTGAGNWAAWISDTGKALALRITQGGDSYKISREMKTYFTAANMSQKQNSWLSNVDDESQAGAGIMFMGIPQGANTYPTAMAVLDYFESDTGGDIQNNRPLHIGFTGKMLTTDLGRKWTVWNLPMCFGALLARSANVDQFCVGSGPNGSGASFGNVYLFSPTLFTDQDYGQMFPSYTTYFFVNHDMETQMQLGGKLKLYGGDPRYPLTTFITGVGSLQVTPLANVVGNKLAPKPGLTPWILSTTQPDDIELALHVIARRCAFTVSVSPNPTGNTLTPATDVSFSMSHLTVPVMANPTGKTAGMSKNY